MSQNLKGELTGTGEEYYPTTCRTTLTDPTFVKLLYDNNVIVWGGDVRDQDAWSGEHVPLISKAF
jgi:hypothetical protein